MTNQTTNQKQYRTMHCVGSSKYVLNFHAGVKTHKDGSPFFDIEIFKNQKKLNTKIKELRREGYIEI